MTTSSTRPDICPVCGQSNRCTLADPRTVDRPCWCFTETIDPAVLAALPEALRDKACLCPRCAGLVDDAETTHHQP
ncbi:MAG: cysteine-rich CWC family protein [Pseudomonas sp.]|uniref:cysteine-rich CWC family protein n=1 Tax=Pseudomonas sp. TaxID=306 RepID=UPI003D6E10A6